MGIYSEETRDVTSKSIDGISDLVVWAPIKEGFIDAFVNVTYETRLRLVAEALHNVRRSSREFELVEPFADTAKRILTLLDFRIGIVDRDIFASHKPEGSETASLRPRKFMYLVATFDGPWEPYIRQIWNPLGAFLDLVLCNCETYKPALDYPFETYAKWVRDHQLDSAIFYSTSGMTVVDGIYLPEIEEIVRTQAGTDSEAAVAGHTIQTPDAAAQAVRKKHGSASLALGMEALNVLYKLTDYYPPVSHHTDRDPDGKYLSKAARELLCGFDSGKLPPPVRELYREAIDWFETPLKDAPTCEADPPFDATQIQKGILTSYDAGDVIVTHGGLLLSRIDDPLAFRQFLSLMQWSWEDGQQPAIGSHALGPGVFLNIAFSHAGLERLGVPEDELLNFPKEFRDGMKERAPQIGDKFANHPRNWTLPSRNWPRQSDRARTPIEPSEIDFVIQIRASLRKPTDPTNEYREHAHTAQGFADMLETALSRIEKSVSGQINPQAFVPTGEIGGSVIEAPGGLLPWLIEQAHGVAGDPTEIDCFYLVMQQIGALCGFTILGIEDMFRPDVVENAPNKLTSLREGRTTTDHFGFRDGISQPTLVDRLNDIQRPTDIIKGDLIYGYQNSRQDFHIKDNLESLRHNGTYMVVRKIEQDLDAMKEVEDQCASNIMERMVGRTRKGEPLVDRCAENDFSYSQDENGAACPLTAHIRLSNPRSGGTHKRELPRILRRGMSYGERGAAGDGKKRGIVFLAYCSSIAEQYEVIQRWLNAGNATLASSAQNDPLTGVHPRKGTRTFRFFGDSPGEVKRVEIAKPLTHLHWGAYFFLPSRGALRELANDLGAPDDTAVRRGQEIIARIASLDPIPQQDEWKRLLEDYLTKDPTRHNRSPLVWQAIQASGGAYRIEHGLPFDLGHADNSQPAVIVTDAKMIDTIFINKEDGPAGSCPYSTREQLKRCSAAESFGAIYVATDKDVAPYPANDGRYGSYCEESQSGNEILMSYTREEAFHAGYAAGTARLASLKQFAAPTGSRKGAIKIDLSNLYIQPALGLLCKKWFGIPDEGEKHFKLGAWTWTEGEKPVCPGDFLAPSRHSFYPRPTSSISWMGKKHGVRLKQAIKGYLEQHWDDPEGIPGVVSRHMHQDFREEAKKNPSRKEYLVDLLGRNIIGIMIGALPPMEASLRAVFYEGLDSKTLWRWQDVYQRARKGPGDWKAAEATLELPVKRAMSIRPAPDLLYRTVEAPSIQLGNVTAKKGDLIVLCLAAASQEALRTGTPDVSMIFGGNRKVANACSDTVQPHHACPAQEMAMGGIIGILAALLDAGRIQALPASLIIQLSDWQKP